MIDSRICLRFILQHSAQRDEDDQHGWDVEKRHRTRAPPEKNRYKSEVMEFSQT